MKNQQKYYRKLKRELFIAAKQQDKYVLETINLIAPASPSPLKYFHNLPLRHKVLSPKVYLIIDLMRELKVLIRSKNCHGSGMQTLLR